MDGEDRHPGPRRRAVHVLAGFAVLSAVLLTVLAVATVERHGAPYPVDVDAHRWALTHRGRVAVNVAVVVTTSGTGFAAYVFAAAGGLLACRRIRWCGALAGVAVLGLGQIVRFVLAVGLHRPRPPSVDWAWTASGFAMPSGHTTTAVITAVVLTVGIARGVRGRARPVLLAVPGLWALGVGASRVYLGVHWLTDVVAGWLLAAVWTALLGLLVLALAHRRHRAVGTIPTTPPG
ncbi:phosphatase PAP2 family protein [Sphaerimonospora cavernae]|uniref:Phosphatase PAP2 family protein n=1 Tax=Sphaerimonospora cavernae TaxID=1740611 RepID=A0ABV6U6B4_9ACTN